MAADPAEPTAGQVPGADEDPSPAVVPRGGGASGRGQPAAHVLALFDLDGTLLRAPDPVHVAAFDHALQVVFGTSATPETLPGSGRLDRALARAAAASARPGLDGGRPGDTFPGPVRSGARSDDPGIDDARINEVMAIMGRYYRLRVGAGDRAEWVLTGAIEVLRKLRAAGVATAVVTGSAREVGERKLTSSGLADFFPVGAFGDEAEDRADLLRQAVTAARRAYGRTFLAANAVVVGDSPADVEAARVIGARVVAVATGADSADQLDEHGPDASFADLTNADAIVRAVRG